MLAGFGASAAGAQAKAIGVDRDAVKAFAARMVAQHAFDSAEVLALLSNAQSQTSILTAIARPAERALSWPEYRARFMTEERIQAGLTLWQSQQAALEKISNERGIPAEYLLAITGIETFFGRSMGRYRVLDALATLAFDYPPRSSYFTRELEQFLLLAREEKFDARGPMGSYAGAMGAPQFMPSSLRAYAVDGDGNVSRDLWQSWPDVFASIANYFNVHGWRRGEAVLVEARRQGAAENLAPPKLSLTETVANLRQRGYEFDASLAGSKRAILVPLGAIDSSTWRVGLQNFYVITRYNRSTLYAMAVHDLAEALRTRRQLLTPATP